MIGGANVDTRGTKEVSMERSDDDAGRDFNWLNRLKVFGKGILRARSEERDETGSVSILVVERGRIGFGDSEEVFLSGEDKYKIRRVDGKDESTSRVIRNLQKKCLPNDKPMSTDNGFWWIAYNDVEAVAFGGLMPSIRYIDTGYLCRAGVVKEHRGKGLQKRLIRVRLQFAKRMGWKYIITDSRSPESGNSLISCGFKLYTPEQPWAYRDSCYWRKSLSDV